MCCRHHPGYSLVSYFYLLSASKKKMSVAYVDIFGTRNLTMAYRKVWRASPRHHGDIAMPPHGIFIPSEKIPHTFERSRHDPSYPLLCIEKNGTAYVTPYVGLVPSLLLSPSDYAALPTLRSLHSAALFWTQLLPELEAKGTLELTRCKNVLRTDLLGVFTASAIFHRYVVVDPQKKVLHHAQRDKQRALLAQLVRYMHYREDFVSNLYIALPSLIRAEIEPYGGLCTFLRTVGPRHGIHIVEEGRKYVFS